MSEFREYAGKRIVDLFGAIVGLTLLGPVLVVGWAAARLSTGASGFYVHDRVGRGQQTFRLLKLRTMRPAAAETGSVTTRNDPRVTRAGAFLRRTKIDELPQLLNVLAGHMSLVGPRPTVHEDVRRMNQEQRRRFTVRPGMTGLAQVSGNTSLSWPRRIALDLEYIDRQSLATDARILVRTLRLVGSGRAETHPPADNEWLDAEV